MLTAIKAKAQYLLQHAGVIKYSQNILWASTGRFFSLGISFFMGALVARYLGPTNYGSLNFAISFVSIFAFVTSFGVDYVITRDILQKKEKQKKILDTAYGIKLIGGSIAVIVIIIFALSGFIGNKDVTILTLIYSTQLLINAFGVATYFFQSIPDHKTLFFAQVIPTVIISIIKLIFIFLNFGVTWFVVSLILEMLLSTLIVNKYFKKHLSSLNATIDFTEAKRLLNDSWPFIFISAFYLIYSKIDQVFIGKMLNGTELGLYVAGVKWAEIWYFLPALICTVFLPAMVKAKETSLFLYKLRTRRLTMFIVVLSIGIALFETLFASKLIEVTFGQDYIFAAKILSIYAWAGIPISIMMVIQQKMTIENRKMPILVSSFVGMVGNIILNIILIPKAGIVGSAWATLISYSVIPVIAVLMEAKGVRKLKTNIPVE